MKISTNQGVDGGRTLNDVQDTGVQVANQWVPRTEFTALDQRIRCLEQLFEDLIERFDSMNVVGQRGRDIGLNRPRARDEYDNPVNRQGAVNRVAQTSDDDFAEENDFMYGVR